MAVTHFQVIAHRFIHYIPGGKFVFITAREGGDVLFHFFLQRGFADVTTIGVFKYFIVDLAVPYQGVADHVQIVFGAECNKCIGVFPIPLALGIAQYTPFHAVFWRNWIKLFGNQGIKALICTARNSRIECGAD